MSCLVAEERVAACGLSTLPVPVAVALRGWRLARALPCVKASVLLFGLRARPGRWNLGGSCVSRDFSSHTDLAGAGARGACGAGASLTPSALVDLLRLLHADLGSVGGPFFLSCNVFIFYLGRGSKFGVPRSNGGLRGSCAVSRVCPPSSARHPSQTHLHAHCIVDSTRRSLQGRDVGRPRNADCISLLVFLFLVKFFSVGSGPGCTQSSGALARRGLCWAATPMPHMPLLPLAT